MNIRLYILESTSSNDPNNARHLEILATEYFGTTHNPVSAGYMLDDGTLLDLSGQKFGGYGSERQMDHREINAAFTDLNKKKVHSSQYRDVGKDSNSFWMMHFMHTAKAVRMSISKDLVMFDIETKPTYTQKREMADLAMSFPGKYLAVEYLGHEQEFTDVEDFIGFLEKI